jgi:hypothetical protein
LIRSFTLFWGLDVSVGVEYHWFSALSSPKFCPFKPWVALTDHPHRGGSFTSIFLPLCFDFIAQRHTVLLSTVIFTIESQ